MWSGLLKSGCLSGGTEVVEIDHRVAERLRRAASKSPNRERHACALIASNGRVIVAACNRWDEHAEERAIRRYYAVDQFRRQRVAHVLVVRITRSGKGFARSDPCQKCRKVLAPLGVPVLHT